MNAARRKRLRTEKQLVLYRTVANTYTTLPVLMSPRPLPEAWTAAGSASPLPTFRRNGDPGMWTPLNLTWMLCTPLSRGMKRTEYMSWSMDWMKQSSSVPDGDTTWTVKTRAAVNTVKLPYNELSIYDIFWLTKYFWEPWSSLLIKSKIISVWQIWCFYTVTNTFYDK